LINQIYIIESLPHGERQTGKELYDDTITRYIEFHSKSIEHNYTFVNSSADFISKLENILTQITENTELILHVEAHGGLEEMQFSNGDLFKWVDLEMILAKINLKTKNGLHLNIATCHGMYLGEKLNLKSTAPYKSYISALRTMLPSEIIEDNTILYQKIIETQNLYKSFLEFNILRNETQLRIKDIETVLSFILIIQIKRFVNNRLIIKDFLDEYLNIEIKENKLNELSNELLTQYIFLLFMQRYLPN
jgi:hypothetical protein